MRNLCERVVSHVSVALRLKVQEEAKKLGMTESTFVRFALMFYFRNAR